MSVDVLTVAAPANDRVPAAAMASLETEVSGLEKALGTIESFLKAHG
jgi:hypothetical protein